MTSEAVVESVPTAWKYIVAPVEIPLIGAVNVIAEVAEVDGSVTESVEVQVANFPVAASKDPLELFTQKLGIDVVPETGLT